MKCTFCFHYGSNSNIKSTIVLIHLARIPTKHGKLCYMYLQKDSWNSTKLHWVSCLFKVNFLHVFLNGVQFVKFENNSLKLSKLYHTFLVCLNNWKLLMKSHLYICIHISFYVRHGSKGKCTCLMYKMKS